MGGFSVFAVQRAEKLAKEWISCCSRKRYVDGSGRNRSAALVEDTWRCKEQRNGRKRDIQ